MRWFLSGCVAVLLLAVCLIARAHDVEEWVFRAHNGCSTGEVYLANLCYYRHTANEYWEDREDHDATATGFWNNYVANHITSPCGNGCTLSLPGVACNPGNFLWDSWQAAKADRDEAQTNHETYEDYFDDTHGDWGDHINEAIGDCPTCAYDTTELPCGLGICYWE